MRAKIDKIIDKMFKKGNFWKTIIILTMFLTTICLIIGIIGYFKIVDVNVNIKKQELKK